MSDSPATPNLSPAAPVTAPSASPAASTPADFVKQRMNSLAPEPVVTPVNGDVPVNATDKLAKLFSPKTEEVTQTVVEPAAPAEPVITSPVESVDPDHTIDAPDYSVESTETETPPVEEPVNPEETPEETLEEEATGPEESLRDLRKINNTLNAELADIKSQLDAANEQIKVYSTGEALPKAVEEKIAADEDRIKQLEYYERLHGYLMSPEYRQAYAEPFEEVRQKAFAAAESYGVDPQVLQEALSFGHKRDRNNFLKKHFDEVGALEVRQLLDQMEDIQLRADEAAKKPQEDLQRLYDESIQREQQAIQERRNNLINVSKNGWSQSLTDVRTANLYPELTIEPNNPEHNNIARPILENAGKEFGKFLNVLADNGVKSLPPQAMKILAKRFQLSEAAAVIAQSRQQYYQRSQEVIQEAKRRNGVVRPQIGAQRDGSDASTHRHQPQSEGAATAGRQLIESVLAGRRN